MSDTLPTPTGPGPYPPDERYAGGANGQPTVAFTPAVVPAAPAPEPVPATVPPSGPVSFEPTHRPDEEDRKLPTIAPPPVEDLPVDDESGLRYRPLRLGPRTLRCAVKMPAGFQMEMADLQRRFSNFDPANMSDEDRTAALAWNRRIFQGIIWDEDLPLFEDALADKREPIDLDDLGQAAQTLLNSYGATGQMGNASGG